MAGAERHDSGGATEDTLARNGQAIIEEHAKDVLCGLRNLGFRAEQARLGATFATQLPPEATLEQRMRAALQVLRPRVPRDFRAR